MPKHFLFDIFSMKLFNFLFGNGSLQLEGGKVKQDLEVSEDILFRFKQNVEGWQTLIVFHVPEPLSLPPKSVSH